MNCPYQNQNKKTTECVSQIKNSWRWLVCKIDFTPLEIAKQEYDTIAKQNQERYNMTWKTKVAAMV